jgi:shikimate kinase
MITMQVNLIIDIQGGEIMNELIAKLATDSDFRKAFYENPVVMATQMGVDDSELRSILSKGVVVRNYGGKPTPRRYSW